MATLRENILEVTTSQVTNVLGDQVAHKTWLDLLRSVTGGFLILPSLADFEMPRFSTDNPSKNVCE